MNISWNAKEYQKDFSFVPAYGEGVVGLLGDIHGRRVLDVGCGNGLLTKKLCEQGAIVTGADAREAILREVEDECREKLLVDGVWHVDYVRIRLRAKAV